MLGKLALKQSDFLGEKPTLLTNYQI